MSELYRLFLLSNGVSIDTRTLKKGQLFFALRGTHDGHLHIEQAFKKGASHCIIDNPAYRQTNCILVADVFETLQKLAVHHRTAYPIPLLAITGTNGKTTTKELITSVLKTTYNCIATAGNFNNHIGVPLSLLAIKPSHEVAVVEMGANHVGEIAKLCRLAQPNFGLITNINKAHLEGFGSLEGVKKAKTELYDYLQNSGGTAFVNRRQANLVELVQKRKSLKTIFYGKEAEYLKSEPFIKYKIGTATFKTRLFGHYNFDNLLTALVVGHYFKIPIAKITHALATYESTNNRSQWIEKNGSTYILDAYNANPASMIAALDNFEKLAVKNKVLILGDMLELGEYSVLEHRRIIDKVEEMDVRASFFCGANFYHLRTNDSAFFETSAALIRFLKTQDFSDTYFLIKGSRGLALEKIIRDAESGSA